MKQITSVFPPEKVQRFSAIEWTPGNIGCTKSHIAVMKMALEQKWKNVLILEDDVIWNRYEEGYKQLEMLASREYDVIHLGPSNTQYELNTLRLYGGSCTSSYLVDGAYIPTLLSNFEDGLCGLIKTKNTEMYTCDKYWQHLMQNDKWYTCVPCLMYQDAGYSDIDLCLKNNQSWYWTLNPNMVTVQLQGGLGNQLFQLAFLDYVSRTNSAIPFLQSTPAVSTHTQNNYFDTIFKNWKCIEKSDVKIHKTIHEHNLTPQNWKLDNTHENIKFIGFFQHYQYIDLEFHKKLDFSNSFKMLEKYKDIEKCVFIHVRGGDYLHPNEPTIYNINYSEYYDKAISMFPTNTKFAIFTNDKAYAMKQTFLNTIQYEFIDENELDSLFLMSKCCGGICVNSTFSWWASLLNVYNYNSKNRITIPSRWFNDPKMYSHGLYITNFQKINITPTLVKIYKGKFRYT